jgi:three-Cys-motif partner protein
MILQHQFGGNWSQKKLAILEKYLRAYIIIFKSNPQAAKLVTNYVDAFAGTGYRDPEEDGRGRGFFNDFYDEDSSDLQKGSARIALEIDPLFDRYLFIDKKPEHVVELAKLKETFRDIKDRIEIVQGEANEVIQKWCQETDWTNNRAVVFLDPYGMEVEWPTVEAIAQTQGIDLWILFPLGVAVNRLLTKDEIPTGPWADRLTAFFGTDEWKDEFYREKERNTIFGREKMIIKKATFRSIGDFFVGRLRSIFPEVCDEPLALFNSKNVPIFLLYFTASNPKGAPTAVKIAQDIIFASWRQ